MADPKPAPHTDEKAGEAKNLTVFGEPLWMDTLKSMGCGLSLLLMTIIVGGALAVAVIAPWGRASHDCSIYCVIGKQFDKYFGR